LELEEKANDDVEDTANVTSTYATTDTDVGTIPIPRPIQTG
jgi:hypothetical protein